MRGCMVLYVVGGKAHSFCFSFRTDMRISEDGVLADNAAVVVERSVLSVLSKTCSKPTVFLSGYVSVAMEFQLTAGV